jgi:hypothetical protein
MGQRARAEAARRCDPGRRSSCCPGVRGASLLSVVPPPLENTPVLLAIRVEALSARRAYGDDELVASWLDSLKSAHCSDRLAWRKGPHR